MIKIYNIINEKIVHGLDIWVKKWVDNSSKYGLVYLLSNGFTSVFLMIQVKLH